MTLPGVPTLHVFDPTGVTPLGEWVDWDALKWQQIVSHAGTHTVEVPLADFLAIDWPLDDDGVKNADRHVVKIFEDDQVYGFKIVSEKCQLAVDETGRRMMRLEDQPGLHSLLEDGVIEPERGLSRVSGDDRLFGFMSETVPEPPDADWVAPIAVPYVNDPDPDHRHRHSDPQINKYLPNWIAADPGPNVPIDAGTIEYFRGPVTLDTGGDYLVLGTGDDFTKLYCNNELLYTSDRTVYFAWRQVQSFVVALSAGDQLFAASVENRVGGVDPLLNVVGLVLVLVKLDGDGNPTGDAIFVTDDAHWVVYIGNPGYRRAQVLLKVVQEAQARAAGDATPNGLTALSIGFTATHDSNGDEWDDPPDQYSFPIATMNLADVATSLSESYMDVYVDPGGMDTGPTLHAYKRQGEDRSASVEYKLGSGDEGTLLDYETNRTAARHTVAYTHLDDGTWIKTTNSAGLAAVGRVEVGLELGTATTAATAGHLAAVDLEKSAKPVIATTGQPFVVGGPVLGVDCFLGDSVTYPAHRAEGTMKLRILMATHDWTGDIKATWPDGVQDPT